MVFKIVFDVNSKSFENLEIVKNILSVSLLILFCYVLTILIGIKWLHGAC